MARGGARPGAGRPKGPSKKQFVIDELEKIKIGQDLPPELPDNPILPLDYMLRVLNDPGAHVDRKDKMAALAAPYLHSKAGEKGGKKESRLEAARQAATGRFSPGHGPEDRPDWKQLARQ